MRTQGLQFERAAETFLTLAGLQIIARNYRCSYGELDLVMLSHHTLVFVEVRQRRPSRFYSAIESVSKKKQQCLIKAALMFLAEHPEFQSHRCRFDVVAYRNENEQPLWLKSAFTDG